MPKRTRCPHCDKLLSRDAIDEHVLRCRERGQKKLSVHERGSRLVVDGNNVAFYLSSDNRPHVSNLALAQASLVSAGYRPVFVVSAALMHSVDEPEGLQTFIAQAEVVRAPRGTDDDFTIIQTARNLMADIVSNDRFLNWIDRYPWVNDRLRKYRMTPSGLILLRPRR